MHSSPDATKALYLSFLMRTNSYGVFRDGAGGLILANNKTKRSCYFQPGDEANNFDNEISMLSEAMFDYHCSNYEEVMVSDKEAGGTVSSDGRTWYFELNETNHINSKFF